jgi:allantoinase
MHDTVIRGGVVVTLDGVVSADVAIVDGRVAAVAPELGERGREEIDAAGLHVLPGAVDAHVHFNEPGRAGWEGFDTGTRAAAAGGTTTVVEMPLNAHPPTVDAAAFELKRRAGERAAHLDFALWGGIVPGNGAELAELAECGVVGFKAFMCATGIDDFAAADDLTLYEGMREASRLGLPVAVHAENDPITAGLAARALAAGRTAIRDFAASRPAVAECEAIARALLLAEEAGCALHVVHVSTGRGVALVAEARARGVDASCETCPHYLALTDEDAERLGAVAKCAPPLRPAGEREALWRHLEAGSLPMVASDHSPAPAALKAPANAFEAWGGIGGAQTMLRALLGEGHLARGLPLAPLAATVTDFPARRLRLSGKGRLRPGDDADLALVELGAEATLEREELLQRHPLSPFVGRRLCVRVARTVLRGETVFAGGRVVGPPRGRLVRPSAPQSGNEERR